MNFGKPVATLAAALGAAMFVAAASAAPVNYQESVSGDLLNSGVLTTFTLDIGINTVSGTFGFEPGDTDGFAFIVPVGTVLAAGSVTLVDSVGDITDSRWRLFSGSSTSGAGTFVEDLVALSPGADDLDSTPLGPQTYNFSQADFGFEASPAFSDYTFSLTLTPLQAVPEPGSLAGGLGAGRARVRAQTPRLDAEFIPQAGWGFMRTGSVSQLRPRPIGRRNVDASRTRHRQAAPTHAAAGA